MDQFDRMLAKWQPTALSLFRFITGLLLFQYGVAKIFKFPVIAMFANPPPLIMTAGVIEAGQCADVMRQASGTRVRSKSQVRQGPNLPGW